MLELPTGLALNEKEKRDINRKQIKLATMDTIKPIKYHPINSIIINANANDTTSYNSNLSLVLDFALRTK